MNELPEEEARLREVRVAFAEARAAFKRLQDAMKAAYGPNAVCLITQDDKSGYIKGWKLGQWVPVEGVEG